MRASDAPLPSIWRALGRAMLRRCPRCGQGKLFRRWLRMLERCPRCALAFEREEGAFLGSMSLNYGITGILFLTLLITYTALTVPVVPVMPLAVASVAVILVVPILFYPFSKTIWAAIDLLLNRMDREDRDEAWGGKNG
jgi:uncharacterized protein (DUF983 family)